MVVNGSNCFLQGNNGILHKNDSAFCLYSELGLNVSVQDILRHRGPQKIIYTMI